MPYEFNKIPVSGIKVFLNYNIGATKNQILASG